MFAIFYECSSLKSLTFMKKLSNYNITNKNIMFHNCEKREEKLIQFLLLNTVMNDNIINRDNLILNDFPFFSFRSKDIISNYILLSNDIILLLTNHLYREENNKNIDLFFPCLSQNINPRDIINKNFYLKNFLKFLILIQIFFQIYFILSMIKEKKNYLI